MKNNWKNTVFLIKFCALKERNVGKMAVLTMIKAIKKIHKEDILLVKIGDFYHVYGKDAYILSYFMGYKIKIIEEKCPTCGFPQKSLSKIEAIFEEKKINYMTLDRRNNYEPEEMSDNKNLNKYNETFEKACKYINSRKKIEEIYLKLLNKIGSEKMEQILNQINMITEEL